VNASSAAPIQLAARPGLAVAFVYLHAQAGGDYFADTPYAWTAGELRKLGHRADVIHVHFDREDPSSQARLCDQLIERLTVGDYGLVTLEHCWLPSLIDQIRDETGALVCGTEPDAVLAGTRMDFVISSFTSHRQPLIDLVTALARGDRLDTLRNLRIHLPGQQPVASTAIENHPQVPDARRPFCPVIERVTIGEPMDLRGATPPVRKTLDTNKGCPFSDPVAGNPTFADVELDDPRLTMAGCAFCPMGGDYKALPWRETVTIHLHHIRYYQANMDRLDEVVLRDQHAIRYAPELLRRAIDEGLRPFGLLIPGRGDAILRYGDAMEEAAEIAAGSGFWWTIYLVGFESFSQAQLDLYNKGVTVAEYAEALRRMRDLHRRFPDAFRLYAAGASSFILWNPWTTLDDLRINIDFVRDNAVWDLARGLTTTRLRLYPNLPLYWKARHDGLLGEGTGPDDRGAAHTGYASEAAWVYRDERVGWAEELHEQLRRHCDPPQLVGLLDACERHVRDADDAPDFAGLEAAWIGLRGLWRTSGGPGDRTERKNKAAAVDARASRTVLVGRSCNNKCRVCVASHAEFEDDVGRIQTRIQAAAKHGRVTIAGREPTLLRELPQLTRGAVKAGARRVELVTNGRVFAAGRAVAKLAAAGVSDVLVKRHRLADEDEDAFTQAPGSGAQMWQAAAGFSHNEIAWRLLLIVVDDGLDELAAIVGKAAGFGARGIQLKVLAANVALSRLDDTREAIENAMNAAREAGLDVAIEGY